MRIRIYFIVYVFYANTQKHNGKGGPRSKFSCLNIKIQASEGNLAAAQSYNTKELSSYNTLLTHMHALVSVIS